MVDRELPADWDHFHVLLEQILKRVPSLKEAKLERLCNGPEAFSPDCKWILGESPEVSVSVLLMAYYGRFFVTINFEYVFI